MKNANQTLRCIRGEDVHRSEPPLAIAQPQQEKGMPVLETLIHEYQHLLTPSYEPSVTVFNRDQPAAPGKKGSVTISSVGEGECTICTEMLHRQPHVAILAHCCAHNWPE